MKKTLMKAGVLGMKILYAPMRVFRVKNKITFISRQSENPSMDIMMLAEEIRKTDPEIDCRILVKMLKPTLTGILSYAGHLISQMYGLATSKVVVIDGYCITACVLTHKPETSLIQIWHSLAAIKKFGYQTLDTPSGHSTEVAAIMNMHRNYDYIACPGRRTGRLFCQAMDSGESRLVLLGLPRIDVISRKDEELAERIRAEYGIDSRKKILLYVPTFRKGEDVQVRDLAKAIDSSRYELVVKLHPVYRENGDIPDNVISDSRYSSYDWLNACDGVITDYSAMSVEAALADKPVYFYLYDLERYTKNSGININPMDEMNMVSSEDAAELAEIIDREYDYSLLKKFREKYVTVETGNCTEKMAEFIVSLTEAGREKQ